MDYTPNFCRTLAPPPARARREPRIDPAAAAKRRFRRRVTWAAAMLAVLAVTPPGRWIARAARQAWVVAAEGKGEALPGSMGGAAGLLGDRARQIGELTLPEGAPVQTPGGGREH